MQGSPHECGGVILDAGQGPDGKEAVRRSQHGLLRGGGDFLEGEAV